MENYSSVENFKEKCGYDVDGTWYPRVTRIVDIKSKPALYRYYGGLNSFAEGERIKKKSATEGTLVHEAVEEILAGKKPEVDPSIRPSIKAFAEFLIENNIQVDPDYIERRVAHHEHRYAGTIDSVALIDGKLGIMDIKTSQAIYRDYNLQTSAYLASLKDEVKNLETRWILRIDQAKICDFCGAKLRNKGGRIKVKVDWKNPYMRNCSHQWSLEPVGEVELQEFPYWQNDFEAFLGAKRLWEWENEDMLKKVGYL